MRKIIAIVMIVGATLFIISCSKEQVKQPDVGDAGGAFIKASNNQLAKYPMDGFAYKSSQLPAQQWTQWARIASPVVKEIVGKIPDGYALEIRGHADARGPEDPEGNKPGNIKISTDRAKAVYNALATAGIKSSKIKYRGLGSSETMPGADARGAQQRRVTFVIVPV